MYPAIADLALTIGSRIRDERQALGLTPDRLSKLAGLSGQMITSVEQASDNPNVDNPLRITTSAELSCWRWRWC